MSWHLAGRPPASRAVRALDRLVGSGQLSGDAVGTLACRWMDGGFFVIPVGEVDLFGHHNTFTEIIGRLRPFGGEPSADIRSRAYAAEGDTLDYVDELDGDTLTIWGGERDSGASCTHLQRRRHRSRRRLVLAGSWPGPRPAAAAEPRHPPASHQRLAHWAASKASQGSSIPRPPIR